jgi:hypothetical protein
MTYTKITTHKQDSVNNLIFQFRKESNVKDLIEIDGDRFQELEDSLNDVYNSMIIDLSDTYSLNLIGEMVGIPRPLSGEASTDDNKYRALVKAKIAQNRSHGTITDVYNILGLLGANKIIARDVPHASLKLQISGDLLLSLSEIITIIKGATAPISLEITEFTSTPFGFLEDPTAYGFGVGELGDSITA